MPRIKNAGAIFRGPYSPVPLGDYMSGSNHVLPTGGTARFAAGLGVHTFMKPVEVIEYDEEGLKALAARINAFAVSEDLPAHGECVLSRFVKDPYNKATLREQEKEAVCAKGCLGGLPPSLPRRQPPPARAMSGSNVPRANANTTPVSGL